MLLDKECDIDYVSDKGRSALHMAVWNKRYIIVKHLIRRDCALNSHGSYGDTPIMFCARRGYPDIMRLLLKAGCNVEMCNREKDTPLHYAVRYGNNVVMMMLIDAGANLEARNIWQHTPLLLASQNMELDIAVTLMEAGCDINALDHSNRTALFYATKNGVVGMVKELLLRGASANYVDNDGNTALSQAVVQNQFDIVRLFIEYNSNVNISAHYTINGVYRWCAPLEIALIKNGNLRIANLLFLAGNCLRDVKTAVEKEELPASIQYSEDLFTWIAETVCTPLRLSDLCRQTIRSSMSDRFISGLEKLPLPPIICRYLAFDEKVCSF